MARLADLDEVRTLVAEASNRLSPDLDDPRVLAVRKRLEAVDAALVAAAGGVSEWAGRAVELLLAFGVSWGVAAAAGAIGFGTAWVIVTTVLVLLSVLTLAAKIGLRIGEALGPRRLARVRRPVRVGRGLTAVRDELLHARVRLVSAALRQVDSRRWQAPYLLWKVDDDRALRRIAHADLLLCQAIDHLEACLAARGAEAA